MGNRKYIITGGPCTGKTSLLEALECRGYRTIPETAREIKKEQKKMAIKDPSCQPILPESNLLEFERMVIYRQQKLERALSATPSEVSFLDRSLVDPIAYSELAGIDLGNKIYSLVMDAGYACVFFLDTLPKYTRDEDRKESFQEATKIHRKLYEVYDRLGFDIIKLPATGIENRVDLVLDTVLQRHNSSLRREIEGKYPVRSLEDIRDVLADYEIKDLGTVSEENEMYDLFNVLGLFGYSLRLRSNGCLYLTIKGKSDKAHVNDRPEFEYTLTPTMFGLIKKIFSHKGSYAKTRQTFVPLGDASCRICLDDVVELGRFVEIEASSANQVSLWKRRLGIESGLVKEPYYQLARKKIHINIL